MSRLPITALLFLLSIVLSGCSDGRTDAETEAGAVAVDFDDIKTPPAVADSATSEDSRPLTASDETSPEKTLPDPLAAPSGNPGIEIVPNAAPTEKPAPQRTTIAGTWEFVLCEFGIDLLGLLIEIEADGEAYTATILDNSQAMPDWTIQSAEITDRAVHIAFAREVGGVVDFEGELQADGIVRGNVTYGQNGMDVVRWQQSERASLKGVDPQSPSENAQVMRDFQPTSEETALAELRDKARELGRSSLAYELYHRLNTLLFRSQKPAEDEYSGLPEEYVAAAGQWGRRVVARAHLEIAYTMAHCGYSQTEAKEHLKLANEQVGEQASQTQKTQLAIAKGLILLQSEEDDEQQVGLEMLQQMQAEDPYNADVTSRLAKFYEQNSQPEQALQLYSELVALSSEMGDMAPVMRLWKELGRDPQTVEDHLNHVYRSRVHQFADQNSDAPRAPNRQRTVVGELFTSTSCPPCIAADVASGGLEITYPKTDFIMLRYHSHGPGPDSLGTSDGEQRGREYYRVMTKPSLLLNGGMLDLQSIPASPARFTFRPSVIRT